MTTLAEVTIPYLEVEELTALLGYKNDRAVVRAIKNKKLEVPTYILAGRHVANTKAVAEFFEQAGRGPVNNADFLED